MKTIKTIIIILLSVNLVSCGSISKSRTIVVNGRPGTTIHYNNYNKKMLGTIDSNGKCNIKLELDHDERFPYYLLSKSKDSNNYQPFLLNYQPDFSYPLFYLIPITGQALLIVDFVSLLKNGKVKCIEKISKEQTTNEDLAY